MLVAFGWTAYVIAPVAAAAIGVVAGFIGAFLNQVLTGRAQTDKELRNVRTPLYKELWSLTETFRYWPKPDLTHADLLDFHLQLSGWYYSKGGIYLSGRSQRTFVDVLRATEKVLDDTDGEEWRKLRALPQYPNVNASGKPTNNKFVDMTDWPPQSTANDGRRQRRPKKKERESETPWEHFEQIRDLCSRLRTELTVDLLSRRPSSRLLA